MSIGENNSIIIYNFICVLPKDKEEQKENISESSSSSFKPIQNNYKIISSKITTKEGPANKIIIINTENNKDDINLNLNGIETTKDSMDLTLEKSKDITIEISNEKSQQFSCKHYFFVNKKKKTGRKPKTSIVRSIHTKYSRDNILRKIKVKFLSKLISHINRIIMRKYNNKIKVLLPLKGSVSQNNTINFNQKLLNSKLKDVFVNYEINGKFRLYKDNYNKQVIESIYEKNIQELIEILEITFLDAFNIFKNININESPKLNGMDKLDKVIEEIKMKESSEDYIDKFKNIAMNFETHYLDKIGKYEK